MKAISTVIFTFWIFVSYCQISGTINSTQIITTNIGDSLNYSQAELSIEVSDIDFLGEIVISLIDTEYEYVHDRIKYKSGQDEQVFRIEGNVVTVILPRPLELNREYRIEVLIRDFQGLYLAPLNTVFRS